MKKDKVMHFLAGIGITIMVGLVTSPLVGFAVAVVVGAAKELIWDLWLKKGTPEFLDFVATAVGAGGMFVVFKVLGF